MFEYLLDQERTWCIDESLISLYVTVQLWSHTHYILHYIINIWTCSHQYVVVAWEGKENTFHVDEGVVHSLHILLETRCCPWTLVWGVQSCILLFVNNLFVVHYLIFYIYYFLIDCIHHQSGGVIPTGDTTKHHSVYKPTTKVLNVCWRRRPPALLHIVQCILYVDKQMTKRKKQNKRDYCQWHLKDILVESCGRRRRSHITPDSHTAANTTNTTLQAQQILPLLLRIIPRHLPIILRQPIIPRHQPIKTQRPAYNLSLNVISNLSQIPSQTSPIPSYSLLLSLLRKDLLWFPRIPRFLWIYRILQVSRNLILWSPQHPLLLLLIPPPSKLVLMNRPMLWLIYASIFTWTYPSCFVLVIILFWIYFSFIYFD